MINIPNDKKTSEETEADEFALNAVIPASDWKKFLARTRDVVPYKIAPYIRAEAEKYGVNPQILFGRYKYDIGMYKIRNCFENKILQFITLTCNGLFKLYYEDFIENDRQLPAHQMAWALYFLLVITSIM